MGIFDDIKDAWRDTRTDAAYEEVARNSKKYGIFDSGIRSSNGGQICNCCRNVIDRDNWLECGKHKCRVLVWTICEHFQQGNCL